MDLTSDRVGHQSFLIFAHFCCLFRFFYPRPSMISLVSPYSVQPDPLGSPASRARKVGPWQPMAPFLGSIQRAHLEYKTTLANSLLACGPSGGGEAKPPPWSLSTASQDRPTPTRSETAGSSPSPFLPQELGCDQVRREREDSFRKRRAKMKRREGREGQGRERDDKKGEEGRRERYLFYPESSALRWLSSGWMGGGGVGTVPRGPRWVAAPCQSSMDPFL